MTEVKERVGQVCWKVDGAFICDLARTWFWDEDKPYEKCEELVLTCLAGNDLDERELKVIAQSIIEGRKKLVGINEFTLEDDNENVRPLSMKLEEVRLRQKISETRDLMNIRMIDFVDPYCTIKSKVAARELDYTTLDECMTYFWYDESYIDHVYRRPKYPDAPDTLVIDEEDSTEGGLWLRNYPDVAYKAMSLRDTYPSGSPFKEEEAEQFWEDLYITIKDDSRFQSKYFQRRNESYLASKRMREEKVEREKKFRENDYTWEKDTENSIEPKQERPFMSEETKRLLVTAKESLDFTTKWLAEHEKPEKNCGDPARELQWHTMSMANSDLKDFVEGSDPLSRHRSFQILPDSYEEWEGLIAPNGDFYSCDFGGHNIKAYHLMCAFPEKFPNIDYNNFDIDMTNALDDLLEQGWCATRYLPTMGCYIELPRNLRGECTKAQKDAIFDAKIKHNVKVDLTPIGF